jgi:penicillin-binding protein 1A
MTRFLAAAASLLVILVLLASAGTAWIFHRFGSDLPDYGQLANYEPPITTRVYAGDGRLFAEYAIERRIFVPMDVIPPRLIEAFLSAEDKTFFTHPGIDVFGIVRAALTNVQNIGTDRRLVGASTITQQVAKNFLLGNEVSMARKFKEALISFRIERAFSKEKILELYLNEIYLGRGSYGVTAASLNYFNKTLDELSIAEAAFLAALPKAPNNYDPDRRPEAALERRNWVIGRMLEDGYITREEHDAAVASEIRLYRRIEADTVQADYFAEDIRREIATKYGEKSLYEGGLVVRSTLDPRLQDIADRELRRGLITYDRRHGWRGPLARLPGVEQNAPPVDWQQQLAALPPRPDLLATWVMAVVLGVDEKAASIGFVDGSRGDIPFAEMKWANAWRPEQRVGAAPRRPADVVSVGDVVAVEAVAAEATDPAAAANDYALRQIPNVDGALVVLDPHTGRVLALAGGFSYARSEFNRATQALRQTGSAFKPFVYLTALENDYVPSQLILDAPIAISQGPGLPLWRPTNYTNKFYGPTTMRRGLELSRNLMTVRLAQAVGIQKIADTAVRFNIFDSMPNQLAFALGAGETTLLKLTAAYAMIVNGGQHITPTLIDRVQDRHGRTVYRHDTRACEGCSGSGAVARASVPDIPEAGAQLVAPGSAYQVVSMMEGVVQRGTATSVKVVDKPVAGKTGTTNDYKDAWFIGFTPDLVVGVFVGFDEPKTLGSAETGGRAAAPIFRDFMLAALEDVPATPFRVPPDVSLVRVHLESGRRAGSEGGGVILEAFKLGTGPGSEGRLLRGVGTMEQGPSMGTGGLY